MAVMNAFPTDLIALPIGHRANLNMPSESLTTSYLTMEALVS